MHLAAITSELGSRLIHCERPDLLDEAAGPAHSDWIAHNLLGRRPTRAAYNGVASRLGTAKVSSSSNLSRNLRSPASTTIRSR